MRTPGISRSARKSAWPGTDSMDNDCAIKVEVSTKPGQRQNSVSLFWLGSPRPPAAFCWVLNRAIFMEEARVERRLAAILAADVAAYSRLMGVDDEGTLAALKRYRRELVDPKITEHRGRIVKTTGDGMLVEFVSVVDAVRCAV